MKLSVLIVTYNAEQFLPFLATSLEQQVLKPDEIIVVDNASTDGTVAWIRSHQHTWKLITHNENLGFTGGFNRAINESSGQYVACVNQDAVLSPTYFSELIRVLDSNLRIASVQGEIRRTQYLGAYDELASQDVVFDSLGLHITRSRSVVNIGEGECVSEIPEVAEIFGVAGTLPIYRRSALEDVCSESESIRAYFDPRFFLLKEDVDMAWRLRRAGYVALVDRKAIAYHLRTFKKNTLSSKFIRGKKDFGQTFSISNQFRTLMSNERWQDFVSDLIFTLPAVLMYGILAVRSGIVFKTLHIIRTEWKARRIASKRFGNADIRSWKRIISQPWSM